jgi:starch-binding outer membrane protein, SusD/RagB family
MKLKHKIFTIIVLLMMQLASCKKFVTIDPPITNFTGESVYNSDATAASVLTGVYTNLSSSGFTGGGLTSNCQFSQTQMLFLLTIIQIA